MIEYADVILGLQLGDEGKGKITNKAMQGDDYNLVVRYNGGSNAGHTVYWDGVKVVTHQVPIGVLHGTLSIIGPGCVVNLAKLDDEMQQLLNIGIQNPYDHLYIDKRAHVVQQHHLDEDALDEKIGSTKQGIGPTYRDKYGRTGKTIEMCDLETMYPQFKMTDIYSFLHTDETTGDWRILCEGAQAFGLDPMWGDYPYVTSSHCTVAAAIQNGIPYNKIRNVFGVAKSYETYVGNKTNFVPECQRPYNKLFGLIGDVGKEYGATTGRRRQVRFLNLDELIPAVNVNGVTHLVLNKMDVLDEVELLPVAHQYGTVYQFQYQDKMHSFPTPIQFRLAIVTILQDKCPSLVCHELEQTIKFSYGAQ